MTAAVYQNGVANPKRSSDAEALFASWRAAGKQWLFAHRRGDGRPCFIIPGTPARPRKGSAETPARVAWYTDLHGCNCPPRRQWKTGEPCKHMLAVRLWFDAYQRGEIALPPRATSADAAALVADAAAIPEMDAAAAADAVSDLYDYEQAKAAEAALPPVALDWWQADDGRPVWLTSEDRYEPDTVRPTPGPVLVTVQPEPAPSGPDPRHPESPFPWWMSGAERVAAQIEQLDREDAEGGDADPIEAAALAAYEEHATTEPRRLLRRYEELFGDEE